MAPAISEGTFARKQICCPARLIAWSHRRRFQTGLELARSFAGLELLDYGCGDGTFLAMLDACDHAPSRVVGVEIDGGLVADCERRFAKHPRLRFEHFKEMTSDVHKARFDAVVCMEVLEHVVDMDGMLAQLDMWLKPGGRLLISVPVETGLPLLIKQMGRCVAGWFGVGDYPGTSPYTWAELGRSLFAGATQHIMRPLHHSPDGFPFRDHKGFNWMRLRSELARRFELEMVAASPFLWLTPHLGSQAWFVCRKRG